MESKITGRSGVLGLREEGAETVHLMWGKNIALGDKKNDSGTVVCTCLHCRENYCRQFWLYPDRHHSQLCYLQESPIQRGVPQLHWGNSGWSLLTYALREEGACSMTYPSDAQEPSRRAGRIIQLLAFHNGNSTQWWSALAVSTESAVIRALNRPFPFGCGPSQRHWIRPDFSAWFFMMNF